MKKNKQPRFHELEMKFEKDDIPSEIIISSDMDISFRDDTGKSISPISSALSFAFQKTQKPQSKILGRTVLDPDLICVDVTKALGQYDQILAVDTNTKEINGEIISVCCVVKCQLDLSESPKFTANAWPDACIEVRNITEAPERLFWEVVLRGIVKSEGYEKLGSVAIVVDSELGRLDDMNNRTEAIRADYMLPEKCSLIYASADKGREWIGYHLIKLCDRVASIVLEGLENNPPPDNSLTNSSTDFVDRFRYWDVLTTKKDKNVHIKVSPRS